MKKLLLIILSLFLSILIYGQEIKVSIAPTINVAPHYGFVSGGPGQHYKAGFSTSLDYLFLNEKRLNFGFGINYHFSQVEFVPNLNTHEMLLHSENVNLISLMFKSVCNFKKYFYLSLDPTIDFHINYDSQQTLDNQAGLGLSLGFGKNIKLNDFLLLNIEPKLWIHNIIPFHDLELPFRLTTAGLNLGLVFGHLKSQQPD
jgi:hypothetical protein